MHLKLLIDKIIEIIENEIMKKQEFGAGIWHFATYLDRYATDGYGEPRSVIEAIELAGKVTDLSYVDINYPYFGGEFSNEQITCHEVF